MKKTIVILLFVFMSLFSFGCRPQKVTLTWGLFNMKGNQQVYLDALNEALEEKRLPYRIQFVNISIPFEGDYKTYIDAYIEEIERADFDIISCPGIQNCYDMYKLMADKHLLVPWNDFLNDNKIGQRLKIMYPDPVWDVTQYNGTIYGVPTPNANVNYYVVFNDIYAEKYGIDLSRIHFSEIEEYLYQVAEEEKKEKNNTFVVSTYWQHFLWGKYEASPCELIYFDNENGKWTAKSMIHSKEGLEHIKRVNSWGDQGLITYGDYAESIRQGNFLMMPIGYSYSEESAENTIRNTFSISSDIKLHAIEFSEFSLKFKGNGYKVGIGTKSKHIEDAMEALAIIYSDSDLSDALVYGKEGISYYIEDGFVFMIGDYKITGAEQQISFGNSFLTKPSFRDSLAKKEELWNRIEETEISKFSDITFKLDGIDQNISQLNVLFLEKYQDLLFGCSINMEEDLKALLNEADELGLEKVIEELNQQLRELQ